jgi:type I restriction-modification system DNA methylase subunit
MRIDQSIIDTKDIQAISNRDGVAGLFLKLGYNVDRLEQSSAALGITADALIRRIEHIEQIAVQDALLYIYLFEMKSMRVSDREALARSFRDLAGEFLLVITSDYETIDFVLLEPQLPGQSDDGRMSRKKVNLHPRVLTVRRRNPSLVDLRVLRRFEYTEPDALYQFEKLKSAYIVAEWSEPLFNNRALFSDYYLNQRLPERAEWKENTTPVYTSLRKLLIDARSRLAKESEEKTQAQLIEPALEALDFKWEKAEAGEGVTDQPDYYLYIPDLEEPVAVCLAYRWDRYLDGRRDADNTAERPVDNPSARVVSVLQSGKVPYAILTNGKLWRLYSRETHSRATNYYEINLEETLEFPDRERAIKYFWLFFRRQAFEPESMVYEGEVRELSFLDQLRLGSEDYAKQLGKRLKDRVFDQIFPNFAGGFIEYIRQQEKEEAEFSQKRLDLIYQSTLTFLYRLMFLLYAESRDLLPVNDARGYAEISLKGIKEGIAKDAGNIEDQAPEKIRKTCATDSTQLYEHLQRLFAIIDKGDPESNMPRYNGGLFITEPGEDSDTQETITARLLKEIHIPDRYLALGLDRLARDVDEKTLGLVQIDFKSLGVRQLGSIYEGLLEFKLRIAPEKMAIVEGKRTEEIIPYAQAKKKKRKILLEGKGANKKERVIPPGEAYLENNRQERKAMGSYYTPDYIVKYIVKHTVGPVLDEKFEALRPKLRDAERRYHQHRKNAKAKSKAGGKYEDPQKFWNTDDMRQLAYEALDIKVLDPAMGSGHFLVEVVDRVTDRMIDFLNGFPDNPVMAMIGQTRAAILEAMDDQRVSIPRERLTDTALLKRQVLKRCVYGVDLNPMAVELAKVSLWLDAFTLGAPLSFLDHHLRCGNSLIGTMAREAERQMTRSDGVQLSLFQGPFVGLLRSADIMREIGMISDATIGQAQESANMFYSFEQAAKPYKQLLDVFTIQHFGIERAKEFLEAYSHNAVEAINNSNDLANPYQEMLNARKHLFSEFRYFHWDLEFPEVFIDLEKADWKSDQGFDAIVGNPPYDELSEHALNREIKEKKFLSAVPIYKPVRQSGGRMNWYHFFMVLGITLLRKSGRNGFIVPMSWMGDSFTSGVRKWMLYNHLPLLIEAFPQKDDPYKRVFFDAKLPTSIYIVQRDRTQGRIAVRVHPAKDILPSEYYFVDLPTLIRLSPDTWLIPLVSPEGWKILQEIASNPTLGILAEEGAEPTSGEIIFNATNRPYLTDDQSYDLILRGSHVQRYEIAKEARQGTPIYLKTKEYLASSGRDTKAYAHKSPRIVYQEGSAIDAWRRVVTAYLPSGQICGHKICYFVNYRVDMFTLLAIFASRLINWIVESLSVTNSLPAYLIGNLPFPKFRFEMLEPERNTISSALVENYERDNFDALLDSVTELIENGYNDAIHDLLAHLGRKMVDFNMEKQSKTEDFLEWLEDQIGTSIEGLSGKTIISGYLGDYQKDEEHLAEDELINRLYNNKSQFSVDFTNPGTQHRIRLKYRTTLEKLLPLKEHLRRTDWLIDQIVYQLYGLTEEEIAIVEGSI